MDISKLRENIVGLDHLIETPYGKRILTYADYTASGRGLKFIENYMQDILKMYANSHTEDDATGKVMTQLLHKSEAKIKEILNASDNGIVIPVGTGATGAIKKLSEILGLYVAPATKVHIEDLFCSLSEAQIDCIKSNNSSWYDRRPVVFISPYEHHSNILIWRESIADVVEIGLTEEGYIDLNDLEEKLQDESYKGRLRIGSFSAASNVTGIKTDVYEVAKILHRYNALACFDFAASGPYVEIDMNKDSESYFDAIYVSPHKFLGGPGASGILVLNEKIYDSNLPPTTSGGGTVDYVSSLDQDYYEDPEVREMAGTPGILQIIRSALVFDLKKKVGVNFIDKLEEEYLEMFLNRFKTNDNVMVLGPHDPKKRVSIISFMVKHNDKYLHPRFITKLLNDLFGIQSRAGCACAGPYGHKLLGIDNDASNDYRSFIKEGVHSLKPGWTRINLHYTMTLLEVNFLMDAIEFISKYGHILLKEYSLDLISGEWCHRKYKVSYELIDNFGIEESLKYDGDPSSTCGVFDREMLYDDYLEHAKGLVKVLSLEKTLEYSHYQNEEYEHYRWFNFINSNSPEPVRI